MDMDVAEALFRNIRLHPLYRSNRMFKSNLTNRYLRLTGCLIVLLGMGVFSQVSDDLIYGF